MKAFCRQRDRPKALFDSFDSYDVFMLQAERTYHRGTESFGHSFSLPTATRLRDAALELAWPTRCAVCDAPGDLICDSCRRALRFYDPWLACANCGAPFGRLQCCVCNSYTQNRQKREGSPIRCASTVLFNEVSGMLIRCYKDAGEQRLAAILSRLMSQSLSPEEWRSFDALAFIPDSEAALIKRGFDHMEAIAYKLALSKGLPLLRAFLRPRASDQRTLTQQERHRNMKHAFLVRPQFAALGVPARILLIDDVMTTGATMHAAAYALMDAGARYVEGLTFARVV